MGIDIPNIRFVICYDIPQSIEDLSQQIGRAARDGLYAEGIVYFSYKDIGTLDYFIESSDVEENIKKDLRRKRDNVVDFCLSKKCRHKILCKYFNEDIDRCLNKCDNCKRK
jgi:ATP-dependent DNA helicase RecQ